MHAVTKGEMLQLVGIDIGGTFTDAVAVTDDGTLTSLKVPTTPEDLSEGLLTAIEMLVSDPGVGVKDVAFIGHGTTVGINALLQHKFARVGLITTRGHGDVMLMMRGRGRTAGASPEQLARIRESEMPEPLVAPAMIYEVSERVDSQGEVLVELNEDDVRQAARDLRDAGAQAIAISFLWAFKNPTNEDRAATIVREEFGPDAVISTSNDVMPKWGEYERTTATVMNAALVPVLRRYLSRVVAQLEKQQLPKLHMMQAMGGLLPSDKAQDIAILTLNSGPVGGIAAAQGLASVVGDNNVITTDMGGTSFDVGIIAEGVPVTANTMVINHYESFIPNIDVTSIGAGGGSIARVDAVTGELRVGPDSAGALPGPACYGRGGTEATVTDANVVLGRIPPERFLGGRMTLDVDAAREAVGKVAKAIGMSIEDTAEGVCRIVEHKMADLIRKSTVQRGHDPREFVIYTYGGAGPVHASAYARELDIPRIVVPRGNAAACWSALGVGTADLLSTREQAIPQSAPFDADAIAKQLDALERGVRDELGRWGGHEADARINRFALMRFALQINEVEVPIPPGPFDEKEAVALGDRFVDEYERVFGEGTGFAGAGITLESIKVVGVSSRAKPHLTEMGDGSAADATRPRKEQELYGDGKWQSVPLYEGAFLQPNTAIEGPAVVTEDHTTVNLRDGDVARIDGFGNVVIERRGT